MTDDDIKKLIKFHEYIKTQSKSTEDNILRIRIDPNYLPESFDFDTYFNQLKTIELNNLAHAIKQVYEQHGVLDSLLDDYSLIDGMSFNKQEYANVTIYTCPRNNNKRYTDLQYTFCKQIYAKTCSHFTYKTGLRYINETFIPRH